MSENEIIKKLLDEIIESEGFIKYENKINKMKFSGNFQGNLSTIEISGIHNNGEKKKLNLFMKTAHKKEEYREEFTNYIFENEILFYTRLSKYFTNVQDHFGVPCEERYEMAKYYNSINEEFTETIILEDLTARGYTTVNRQVPASLFFMNAAIESLAKLQALSFVTEKLYPEIFENEIKNKKDLLTSFISEPPDFFLKSQELVIGSVKNEEHRSKFRDWLKSEQTKLILEKLFQAKRKVCGIRHGDFKTDNVMVNIDEMGYVKTPAIPIDYQFISYGPPVIDLIFIIIGAADASLRSEHFNSWIELYYKTMKKFLKYFSIDVEELYPKDEFVLDIKEYLPVGLFIASCSFLFMFTDHNGKSFSFGDKGEFLKKGINEIFEHRLNEVVKDYVDWEYL